jgi:hypothetical protein
MAKRSVGSNLAAAAKILGKKGGPARARKLTAQRRSAIAAEGGRAKAKEAGK